MDSPQPPQPAAAIDDGLADARIAQQVERFAATMPQIREQVAQVIVGQREVVEHLLITLLTGGHCLMTGMPGTAKTLLVRTLAQALGLDFKRIQFTPDLMPTDVTGTDVMVEDPGTGHRTWHFVPGPIFANVVLADEINRTPPKTQAALLEAMQESEVTVRGTTHSLAPPFLVLATQNPIELEGTYPLPEAQLDRFLFNVLMNHLPAEDELEVVNRFTSRLDAPQAQACCNAEELVGYQWLVRQVPVSQTVGRMAVDLVRATRPDDPLASDEVKRYVNFGASVRASMFLILAGKARALLDGRFHVTTQDIEAMALPVLRHRVLTNYFAESDGISVDQILSGLVSG